MNWHLYRRRVADRFTHIQYPVYVHTINQQAPNDVERLGRTANSYGKAYFFFIAFRLLAWWAVRQGIVCALHDERTSENTLPPSSSKRIQWRLWIRWVSSYNYVIHYTGHARNIIKAWLLFQIPTTWHRRCIPTKRYNCTFAVRELH